MSILGMVIVDSWLVWKQIRNLGDGGSAEEGQKDFYTYLAEELIDNTYDVSGLRSRSRDSPEGEYVRASGGRPRSAAGIHLTPTKKRRRDNKNAARQNRCIVCKSFKTMHLCSTCYDGGDDNGSIEVWLCPSQSGRDCFAQHAHTHHGIDL